MPAKRFNFSIVCMRTGVCGEFSAEAEKLDEAFKRGAAALPQSFREEGAELRMWRFRFENMKTAEFSAAIGQGKEVAAAWADLLKNTRETFRPKNDGKSRPTIGVLVLLQPRAGDIYAKGRVVTRTVEEFESDAPYDVACEPLALPSCPIPEYLLKPRANQRSLSFADHIPDGPAAHEPAAAKHADAELALE